MEEKIKEFKEMWPGYVELAISDFRIQGFIEHTSTIELAVDRGVDYVLANGLGEVQE